MQPAHLLHVGFAKTGSTYLQRWFESHPQIAYRHGGIAGFGHVNDLVAEAAAPDPAIRWRVTSSEALASPTRPVRREGSSEWDWQLAQADYDPSAGQESACGKLAALFPDATVLIVTRGFRSMILSSYSQYVRTGGTETLAQLATMPLKSAPWNYDRLIGLYRQRFGRERVIVMPWELLKADRTKFLRELEGRLGLDQAPVPSGEPNPSLSVAELAWYPRLTRAMNALPRIAAPVRRLYGRAVFEGRLRPVVRLLQRIRPINRKGEDELPAEVVERFRGQAELLRDEPLYAPFADDYLLR